MYHASDPSFYSRCTNDQHLLNLDTERDLLIAMCIVICGPPFGRPRCAVHCRTSVRTSDRTVLVPMSRIKSCRKYKIDLKVADVK